MYVPKTDTQQIHVSSFIKPIFPYLKGMATLIITMLYMKDLKNMKFDTSSI